MPATLMQKHDLSIGQQLFESDHTVWTILEETEHGLRMEADDGLITLTFTEADLSMVSRCAGSEQAIV